MIRDVSWWFVMVCHVSKIMIRDVSWMVRHGS